MRILFIFLTVVGLSISGDLYSHGQHNHGNGIVAPGTGDLRRAAQRVRRTARAYSRAVQQYNQLLLPRWYQNGFGLGGFGFDWGFGQSPLSLSSPSFGFGLGASFGSLPALSGLRSNIGFPTGFGNLTAATQPTGLAFGRVGDGWFYRNQTDDRTTQLFTAPGGNFFYSNFGL